MQSFIKAFDAGDAKALALLFTEDAETADNDGAVVRGRAAIAAQFARAFAADPGAKITIQPESLRFLGREVAKEEGRSTIKPGDGGPPEIDKYTVLYVNQAGHWLQSYVREHGTQEPTPHERLMPLAWMVGEWVDESPDAVINSTCKWSEDGNFLLRSYDVKIAGKVGMSGHQRIGWDSTSGQIKSWVFDSRGGSSEGLWSRDGDVWSVKLSGPLQGGKIYSETNIFTPVSRDMIRWKSIERTVAGQAVPDLGEFVIARKPPAPQAKSK
jgi:uncharacterized protein (TIGR02246 family)